jgi:hypothetical protein
MTRPSRAADASISLLSRLLLQAYKTDFGAPVEDLGRFRGELNQARSLSEDEFTQLVGLADMHHVTVRALRVLDELARQGTNNPLRERWQAKRERERRRIWRAVEWLYAIVKALELSGCSVTVIKSLDHWPDLGSDLDLYTVALLNR